MKKLISSLVLISLSQGVNGIEWEIKNDFKFRNSAEVSTIEYKDDGSFKKRKVKQKDRFKSQTLLTALTKTSVDGFEWVARLGYDFERKNDISLQFKQDDSLKKDKSRVEYERTQFAGLGIIYKMKHTLAADRWVLKTHIDRLFDIEYDAAHLAEDAKDYHGRSSGYEFKAKLQGEYSTSSYSLYFVPMISYRAQYAGYWTDSIYNIEKEAEREERLELGLYLSWLLPIDGFELTMGPLWQQESEAEKLRHSTWQWQKERRTYAHIMLEYEEPIPGFELEIEIEHAISGDKINDTNINFEFSYEF